MTTLPVLLDQMRGDLVLRNLRPATQDQYLARVRAFARHFRRCPSALGRREVKAFLVTLAQRGIQPSSVNLHRTALAFLYEVTLGRPEVMQGVPRARASVRSVLPPLATGDVRALLRSLRHDPYEHAIVTTLLETGLRRRELCGLEVSDIDRRGGLVHVRKGKGGRQRVVVLTAHLYGVLRAYWRSCRPHAPWLFNARRPGAPRQTSFLPPWQRKPLHPGTLGELLARAGRQAGLTRRLSAHDLRRTHATLLLEQGVHRSVIQALLGHASPTTTDRYVQVRPAVIRAVPSAVAAVLGE